MEKESLLQLPGPLVSSEWVEEHLDHPHLKILDASWHMPSAKRNARAEFEGSHIPGAQFFDIDQHSDHGTSLPHMLPSPRDFEKAVSALGIHNEDAIVVYDTVGLFSAARLWWMFRVFGHENVAVLNGGLLQWRDEGRPTSGGNISLPIPSDFKARFQKERVQTLKQVAENLQTRNAAVIDARSATRFSGKEREPRPGVRSGHIPGSQNLHYARMINTDGTMKTPEELEALLKKAGVDYKKPVISSCGSGVTACILDLALEITRHPNHAIYDGSWAEWGSAQDTQIDC